MSAKIIARVLLTLGFLAASVGYSSWAAQRTFFDPSATQGATQALLATPAVKTMLTREIRTALQPALGQKTGSAGTAKLDAAIDAAVNDPKFIGAFENAIMHLHQEVLSGNPTHVTLDSTAVTNALNRAIARIDPKIAPKARKLRPVRVPIGGSGLPHIGDVRHNVTVVGNAAIAIAILLVGGALLLAHDRKMFRRTGSRVAFLALPPALVFLVVPRVLESSHNSALSVSVAILHAYGHRVLFSAAILAGAGISTWLIAMAIPSRRQLEPDAPSTAAGNISSSLTPDTRLASFEPAGIAERVSR